MVDETKLREWRIKKSLLPVALTTLKGMDSSNPAFESKVNDLVQKHNELRQDLKDEGISPGNSVHGHFHDALDEVAVELLASRFKITKGTLGFSTKTEVDTMKQRRSIRQALRHPSDLPSSLTITAAEAKKKQDAAKAKFLAKAREHADAHRKKQRPEGR